MLTVEGMDKTLCWALDIQTVNPRLVAGSVKMTLQLSVLAPDRVAFVQLTPLMAGELVVAAAPEAAKALPQGNASNRIPVAKTLLLRDRRGIGIAEMSRGAPLGERSERKFAAAELLLGRRAMGLWGEGISDTVT